MSLPHFNGPEYAPEHDQVRLTNQLERVKALMADGAWRTLSEIEAVTGDPHASISAQLRHLRKPRFGSYFVDKRPRGDRQNGLYEYRVMAAVSAEALFSTGKPPDFSQLGPELEAIYNKLEQRGETPSEEFFDLVVWAQRKRKK